MRLFVMANTAGGQTGAPSLTITKNQEQGAVMLKSIAAVMAAAAIVGVLTLLSATNARLDAGPLAKPAEAVLKACTQQPWPYLNCVGTPLGNPRIRLVTTDRLTP
jgi:hypothetical protein